MTPHPPAAPIVLLALLCVFFALFTVSQAVNAAPTGASVGNLSTEGSPNPTPDNRSDPKGTITTLLIDAVQQDQFWKAYVGNITGRLSLDNANGYTIYDWALSSTSKTGRVYVSRYLAPAFDNVTCANAGNVSAEHVYFNMSVNQSDNIANTFNYSSHSAFTVGTQPFNANTCNSTATYVNDSRQTMDGSQDFQEVILQDSANNIIFMTILSTGVGYDNETYDFQLIVPESYLSGGALRPAYTTYYFFTELSG